MTKKIFFPILFVLLLLGLYVFWMPLQQLLLEKYLEQLVKKEFNGSFHYTAFYFDKDQWVVENPEIYQSDEQLVKADKLLLAYSFHPFERTINIDLDLIRPLLNLSPSKSLTKSSTSDQMNLSLPKMGFWKIAGHLHIDRGMLKALDRDQIAFDCKVEMNDRPNFYLTSWHEEEGRNKKLFSLIRTFQDQSETIELELHAVDCLLASNILGHVIPSLTYWEIQQGTIDGRLISRRSEGQKQWPIGKLTLKQLEFHNSRLKLSGSLPEVEMHFYENKAEFHLQKHAKLSHSNEVLDRPWINWAFTELTGKAFFVREQPIQLSLDGVAHYMNESVPMHLQSLVALDNLNFLTLNLAIEDSLALNASAKIVPEGVQINGLFKFKSDELEVESQIHVKSTESYPQDDNLIAWLAGITDLYVKRGTLSGQNLSLKNYQKFISPSTVDLEGVFNLRGSFDANSLFLSCEIPQIKMVHPEFELSLAQKVTPAYYYIEFNGGSHGGFFPIDHAKLLHKKSGLLVEDIKGQLFLKKNQFFLSNFEGYCQDLFIAGDIEGVHLEDKKYALTFNATSFASELTRLKSILEQLNFHLPVLSNFNGNLFLQDSGAYFKLIADAQKFDLMDAKINLGIIDGQFAAHPFASLQEISCKVNYDYRQGDIVINDIQGVLFLGKAPYADELLVAGDFIRCNSLANLAFDIWVGDKNRDLLRLAGKTKKQEHSISLELNSELSHLGTVYPEHLELLISENNAIEKAKLAVNLELTQLFEGINYLRNIGLFSDLAELPDADGKLKILLDFQQDNGKLNFEINGSEITLDKHELQQLAIKGSQKGSHWLIDELIADDWHLSADLNANENLLNINFLGLKFRDSFLLGASGEYSNASKLASGKINLLEIELEELKNIPGIGKYLNASAGGQFKGNGQFTVKKETKWKVEAALQGSLKDPSFNEYHFADIDHFIITYSPERILTLKDISTDFLKNRQSVVQLKFNQIAYDLNQREAHLEADFQIPSSQFAAVEELLPENLKILNSLDSNLKGSLKAVISSDYLKTELKLTPGYYQLKGTSFYVENFELKQDPLEVELKSQINVADFPLTLQLKSPWPKLNQGSISLRHAAVDEPLIVSWSLEKGSIELQKIEGQFPGLNVYLLHSSPGELVGEISADLHLLPQLEIFKSLGIEGNYFFKGAISFTDHLNFKGSCESSNFNVKGYQFDRLTADFKGTLDKIMLDHLFISDQAGTLTARQIELVNHPVNGWSFSIDKLTGAQLRPSLLRGADFNKESTFVIRKLEIDQLQGNIKEPHSIRGNGVVHCSNPPKRDLPNPLWNISTELLSTFGLNHSLLTPVAGTILFDIQEGKILFKKFKDMYSAGKLSKFYLPKDTVSYMDFDGGLHLQVRMKQYTLLMKFAELFTVNIEGNIKDPRYSVMKQKEDDEDLGRE